MWKSIAYLACLTRFRLRGPGFGRIRGSDESAAQPHRDDSIGKAEKKKIHDEEK